MRKEIVPIYLSLLPRDPDGVPLLVIKPRVDPLALIQWCLIWVCVVITSEGIINLPLVSDAIPKTSVCLYEDTLLFYEVSKQNLYTHDETRSENYI